MKTSAKPQQVSLTTLTIPDVDMNEPGGLSYHPDSHYLYIADTNKHCVRRIAIPLDISESMQLTGAEMVSTCFKKTQGLLKLVFDTLHLHHETLLLSQILVEIRIEKSRNRYISIMIQII